MDEFVLQRLDNLIVRRRFKMTKAVAIDQINRAVLTGRKQQMRMHSRLIR